MPDFASLNNKPMADYTAPPPLPAGTYLGTVTQYAYRDVETKNGKDTVIDYTIVITAPGEDIEPEHLVDASGAPIEARGRTVRASYFFGENNSKLYIIRNIAESLGIDLNQTPQAVIEGIKGNTVQVVVDRQPDKNNPETIYNNVRKMAAVV